MSDSSLGKLFKLIRANKFCSGKMIEEFISYCNDRSPFVIRILIKCSKLDERFLKGERKTWLQNGHYMSKILLKLGRQI